MRPYTIIYSTMTVDGRIASKTRYSQLSCPHDLKRLHALRASCDAVMVGANTVIIDDPSLRVKYVEAQKNPIRIIVDGMLRVPHNARVFTLKTAKTVVLTTSRAPKEKIELLKSLDVEVIVFPGSPPIDMRKAMEVLYEMNIRSILVEGGGELNWYLFKDGVVSEVRVTIAPIIFGGRDAVSLVMGEGFSTRDDARKLRLIDAKICECSQEVHLIYSITENNNDSTE